jgi:hypothetical protein
LLYKYLTVKNQYAVEPGPVWRYNCEDGWFLLGVNYESGNQMTYHLPIRMWNQCGFADTLKVKPVFDGHTSADVLQRLKSI